LRQRGSKINAGQYTRCHVAVGPRCGPWGGGLGIRASALTDVCISNSSFRHQQRGYRRFDAFNLRYDARDIVNLGA